MNPYQVNITPLKSYFKILGGKFVMFTSDKISF